MCRSIVIKNNKILAFSPPKSLNYDSFTEKHNCSECLAEDFIDGTMINLFYDETINCWEIATRATIGGNTSFYINDNIDKTNNKTFREMFFDACNINKLNIDLLDNNYCYSFVMQHPNHRIVTPIDFPKLFLIRAYCIDNTNFLIKEIPNNILTCNSGGFWNTGVIFPNKYVIDDYSLLSQYYNNTETPFYCVGIMIYFKNYRTKIRNDNYEYIRKLRGNQSKLQYHYLTLRQNGKVREFLLFYPEYSYNFVEYRNTIHEYTNNLYKNYIHCYIKKQQELKTFSYEYKVHMFNIHQTYLTELKPQGDYIDKKFVINYFNKLHPSQQMHVLNCKKKYELDKNMEL